MALDESALDESRKNSLVDGTHTHPFCPRHIILPLLLFAAIRIFDAVVLSWASGAQVAGESLWHLEPFRYLVFEPRPADPGVLGASSNWDGEWYRLIATAGYGSSGGYPGELGDYVADRSWAFPPAFPVLIAHVMTATGLAFTPAALVTNAIAGSVAVLLVHRLALPRVGELGANGAVALTCCWVSAPVLHFAYSEALALALLAAVLLALERRRPWLAAVLVIPLALTRLITPALALVALACYLPLIRHKRETLTRWEMAGVGAVALSSVLGVFTWSAVVEFMAPPSTEDRAVAMTEGYSGGWFGQFWGIHPSAAMIPLLFILIALRIGWSERSAWGITMSSWVAAYCVTLVLLTPLHVGIVRYSLLAFPLSLIVVGRQDRPRRWRVLGIGAACVALLVLQIFWIRYAYIVDSPQGNEISP